MNILSISGSPRKNGDSETIVSKILKNAEKKGNTVNSIRVYDMNFKGCVGCMACTEGKVDICIHNDDFTKVFKDIEKADCIIFSTPIYFGHMTGPLKSFLDRMYTFVLEDHSVKILPKKKFITVVTSGAPEYMFCNPVSEYLKTWFGEFLHMELIDSISAGGLSSPDKIQEKTEILKKASQLGSNL